MPSPQPPLIRFSVDPALDAIRTPFPTVTPLSELFANLELVTNAILVIDGNEEILFVNDACAHMFAYAASELVGVPLCDLISTGQSNWFGRVTEGIALSLLPLSPVAFSGPTGRRHDGSIFPLVCCRTTAWEATIIAVSAVSLL